MKLIELYYEKVLKKDVPYYAKYSLGKIVMKPIIKFFNLVIIPNTPFLRLRVMLYRLVGFKIGKNSDIGMKCYLDEINPSKLILKDNVTVSCGVYFTCHGKNQTHTKIVIEEGAYIGMRANILSGKNGITIGKNVIVGAGTLVNKSIPDNATVVGVPARIVSK
ncbi:Serine acetyltransferase [hydrothermal vent metagenome]|uniref:Serine acetyltransferase n=1 Tax=hydrothermal vent metagenome TaxID=652676 RepID=A0A1W1CR10_9ZZZZ